MRAPGEAPGMMALEIAMDEMAERLKLDPIEFRILPDNPPRPSSSDPQSTNKNEPQAAPASRPFSQRQLVQCLRTGADTFGWSKRSAIPGQAREGSWLVGLGVAAAFRNNQVTKSAARVRLESQWPCHGGNRYDGHWYGQLYGHRADRRRDDGCPDEPRRCTTWQFNVLPSQQGPAGSGAATARRQAFTQHA